MKDNHIGMHPLLHRYKPPNDLDEPLPSPTRPLSINEADKAKTTLASLPPEVHLLITPYLSYPDALSLKHASRYFYDLVYTGVNLKIEWLIERRRLHLDCPVDIGRGCELGSDVRFCRGSVALLMKRRREHGECDTRPGGRGCLVFGTGVCTYRKIEKRKWVLLLLWIGKFMRENGLLAWAIVALLGAVLACGWLSLHDSQAQASELEL